MIFGRQVLITHGVRSILTSFWTQLLLILIFSIIAPVLAFYHQNLPGTAGFVPLVNSVIGAFFAILAGILFVRRVTSYPGVRAYGFILPSFAAMYAIAVTVFFALRIDYGRIYFGASFITTVIISYASSYMIEKYVIPTFLVVPVGDAVDLLKIERVNWVTLIEPKIPSSNKSPLVADLRSDLGPTWGRILAETAIEGVPVYHSKQLGESLTGRVSLSHMSENSFGSLVPNLGYRNVKRALDLVGAIILIPFLLIPVLIIAGIVVIDSPGGAFFLQRRMGFRGKEFKMIKFRTMKERKAAEGHEAARRDAITLSDDVRVTRSGRFLRRTRLDEIPQLINVLKGEMSFIGPRPEAVELSRWYESELAFYRYRHIVRPGITGWAQVNQGHVAELEDVGQKLNYDFFYIKNFSSWLDVLILFKTVHTVVTGFGSR